MGPGQGDPSMAPHAALADVLTQRAEALLAYVAAARQGTVEGVHQARVASRHLREAVPVAAVGLRGVRRQRLRRALRRLTRGLGPVRDCDVALLAVSEMAAAGPDDEQVLLRAWLQQLRAERRDAETVLHAALGERRVAKLRAWLHTLAEARLRTAEGGWRERLAHQIDERASRLRQRIDRAGPLFVPERLHAVRIAGKQLRYVLELAGACGLASVGRLLTLLKRNQGTLGRLQDLDVLTARLRALPDLEQAAAETRRAAEQLTGRLDREMRLLHAAYLRRRSALMRLADDARDRVVPAVRRPSGEAST